MTKQYKTMMVNEARFSSDITLHYILHEARYDSEFVQSNAAF